MSSKELNDRIEAEWRKLRAPADIARDLGVDRDKVRQVINQRGLRRGTDRLTHRWTEAEDAVIAAAVRDGSCAKQIAHLLPGRRLLAIRDRLGEYRAKIREADEAAKAAPPPPPPPAPAKPDRKTISVRRLGKTITLPRIDALAAAEHLLARA